MSHTSRHATHVADTTHNTHTTHATHATHVTERHARGSASEQVRFDVRVVPARAPPRELALPPLALLQPAPPAPSAAAPSAAPPAPPLPCAHEVRAWVGGAVGGRRAGARTTRDVSGALVPTRRLSPSVQSVHGFGTLFIYRHIFSS